MTRTPAVALPPEPVARLVEEGRLGEQLLDSCPGDGEFPVHRLGIPFGIVQLGLQVAGRTGRVHAAQAVLALAAGLGEAAEGAVVHRLGGVGCGGQSAVFGMRGLSVAAGVLGEAGQETWTVVGRGRCGGDPMWVAEHGR
jgi:hypothetical protein